MICNKCGAYCDDLATVCATCGEPLADAFELVQTPEELKKEKTGKILGIVSIALAGLALIAGIICNSLAAVTLCVCLTFVGYTIHFAGIITGVISMIMSNKKMLGIIGVTANILLVVIPLLVGIILGVLGVGSIAGIVGLESMNY